MNRYEHDDEQQRQTEPWERGTRASPRGYGEGYATAGMRRDPRQRDWEEGRFRRDEYERWGRGLEDDEDVRSQYGGGYQGGYESARSGRQAGAARRQDPGGSGYSEYRGGQREYGRGFDDSNFSPGGQIGDYARPGGEYSQGFGRERNEGRVYGPEDFSQRYVQGESASARYGEPGRGPNTGYPADTSDWRGQRQGQGPSGSARFGGERASQAQGGWLGYRGRGPRGYTRSDERITEDLNERLTDDPMIDASDLQVSVSNGVATLSGSVDQRWLKHHAENIADACSGVRDVRNEIRVVSSAAGQAESTSEAGGAYDNETGGRVARSSSSTRTGAASTSASSGGGSGTSTH